MRLWHIAGVGAAGAAAWVPAVGQPVVVPIANASSAGGVSPSDTLTREFPRTHQQVIAASELGSIPIGASITQITFRASNFGMVNALGNWPPVTLTFADYEVYLGRAARSPGSMSTVFFENFVAGTQVRVRDGALTIDAGSYGNFVAPPGANPWGVAIQLAPYVYTGGDLVVMIRHSGHLVPQTPRLFVDSLPSQSGTMQCMAAGGMGASVGSPDQSLPVIVRMRFVAASTCVANCDGSTGSPVLTGNDFLCFVNQYAAARQWSEAAQITSYANCDGSTTPPVLNIGDFVCFNARFAVGCT